LPGARERKSSAPDDGKLLGNRRTTEFLELSWLWASGSIRGGLSAGSNGRGWILPEGGQVLGARDGETGSQGVAPCGLVVLGAA
jgi:hypothetical protein